MLSFYSHSQSDLAYKLKGLPSARGIYWPMDNKNQLRTRNQNSQDPRLLKFVFKLSGITSICDSGRSFHVAGHGQRWNRPKWNQCPSNRKPTFYRMAPPAVFIQTSCPAADGVILSDGDPFDQQ